MAAALLASIGLTLAISAAATPAAAVAPNGETISCEPGQTANNNLGTCQDPLCGPGTVRDPSGASRACVTISCPPGETLVPGSTQCLVNPPPAPRCPNGAVGQLERLSTGVTIINCPKTLPPPPPPPPSNTKAVPNATLHQ